MAMSPGGAVTLAVVLALASAAPAEAALKVPARVQGGGIALQGAKPRFWAGVNLGATIPGHAPGELPARRSDYDRWLKGIGALHARVVRVYTILRPVFYDALAAYNRRHRSRPLYFIQGVWIPEEQLEAAQDAYAVTQGFDDEIADAVKVVHGAARLPRRPGHASGRYRSDVSRWLLAWSPGIEWDPVATHATDVKHAGTPPYAGRYITATPDASPMESWLAARLDHLATLERKRGWSRPLTFTNWLTDDPLRHPAEPLADEDLVSVDAMHLRATAAWPGGFFASYHAYPYYPDFLRLEPRYASAPDPYAAYLADLKAHHQGQAVMITELGVPSGLGAAHRGPLGRDQGDHSEREQGAIDASLVNDVRRAGFAGGVVFEYTDEWFKRTWNTEALALPVGRRPLWHNVLTNESQFGLVAVEPDSRIELDGRTRDWKRVKPLHPGLRVAHDAAYLYLLVQRRSAGTPLRVGFDVRPGGGEDVRVTLGPGRSARLEQSAVSDPLPGLFGVPPASTPWVSPRLLLNRDPFDFLDLGTLRWGSAAADVRNLAAGDGRTVELRLPWMLLGFADPSAHRVYHVGPNATVSTSWVRPTAITLDGAPAGRYRWAGWNRVRWHERRKAGWALVRRAFG
jgi:hypothetical protein